MNFEYNTDKEKCWFRKGCNYGNNIEYCKNNFCILNHKMDFLTQSALMSEKDKYPIKLFPDANGTDYDKFVRIKAIQTDIKEFVNNGKNLLIYSKITGNGKSASAKKLLLAYLASIIYEADYECRALYINLPRLFNELKDNISKNSEYVGQNKVETNFYPHWF